MINRTMPYTLSIVFVMALLIAGACSPVIALSTGRDRAGATGGYLPKPRIIEPSGEILSLGDRQNVMFKWSPHEGRGLLGRYYVFRLYKGYDMVETSLLKKESTKDHKLEVDADIFLVGEVYTWSIRQRYRGFGRSARSSHSFMVVE